MICDRTHACCEANEQWDKYFEKLADVGNHHSAHDVDEGGQLAKGFATLEEEHDPPQEDAHGETHAHPTWPDRILVAVHVLGHGSAILVKDGEQSNAASNREAYLRTQQMPMDVKMWTV